MIEFVPNMDSSMGDPGIINRSPSEIVTDVLLLADA